MYTNLNSLFSDIANTIRDKTGTQDPIAAEDFPFLISTIGEGSSGGGSNSSEIVRGYQFVAPGTFKDLIVELPDEFVDDKRLTGIIYFTDTVVPYNQLDSEYPPICFSYNSLTYTNVVTNGYIAFSYIPSSSSGQTKWHFVWTNGGANSYPTINRPMLANYVIYKEQYMNNIAN